MVTKEQILEAVKNIKDPSNNKPLGETGGVRQIFLTEEENKAHLVIALEKLDTPAQAAFQKELLKVLKLDLGIAGVKLEYTTFQKHAKSESKILAPDKNIKFVAVASGKGGVGKSTVTANLAVGLTRIGKKVGIIDADIYGSSISKIMEIEQEVKYGPNTIYPVNHYGIEIVATDMLTAENKPLMWRGPMLGKMLEHFFNDVAWSDDLEYVLIDLPPGTGDVALDIQRIIPECKQLIVTTPHPSASHVAVRAGLMAKELKHEIIGIVENMSYFEHKGDLIKIFGEGGGDLVASDLEVPVIAQIPIAQPEHSNFHSIFGQKDHAGEIYMEVAKYVDKYFEK